MQYIKNEHNFSFLTSLKNNYQAMRDEFINFSKDKNIDLSKFVVKSSAQNSINKIDNWKVLAFYMHLRTPIQIIKEYQASFPYLNIEELSRGLSYVHRHFPVTLKLLGNLIENESNGIVNAWFSYFEPGTKLRLHINDDPYMYRVHLGLIVPEGDIGFKVCNEVVKWKEGEMIIFAPTNPHTAWNLTDKPRVLLIVDFFKPEGDREEMKQLEREQFEKMMKKNPLSFGMSGGYSDLDEETIKKYAVAEIEKR